MISSQNAMVHNANELGDRGESAGELEIFLHAGDFYFGSAPTRISTSLRSRVVVTFWHPATKIGGMCHVVLMDSPEGKSDMRYGDCAVAEFAKLANTYHTPIKDYEVRIYGGSGMLPDMQNQTGKRNGSIDVAGVNDLLKLNGFVVTEVDIADVSSRKINFDLFDGGVKLQNTASPASGQNRTIAQQDKDSGANRKNETAVDVMEVFLHPGDLYFGRAPTIISTLLGSCVAATLWHPKNKIGGMCHIVLPESPAGTCEMRYGDCAIDEFAKQATKYNTKPGEYEVHLYGGSDMFPDMKKSPGMKIGDRNIEKVKELLNMYKFRIKEIDTGGSHSRKIKLDLSDGSVWARNTSKPVEG